MSETDQLETLQVALDELRNVVASLRASDLAVESNCEPWTVKRLASHALNNQLLWGGLVTGEVLVSPEQTMTAAPYEGDLGAFADDVHARALKMWSGPEVLGSIHTTPLGDLPGTVVILFPTVDALAHAWDLSSSVGRSIEFSPDAMSEIAAVFGATCTDHAREIGLIQPETDPPPDATATERLLATAGRTIPR